MPTVITSCGTRVAENVNITSVVGGGPWTVTLSGAPTTTNVGDILNDEAAAPNTYLITGISGADLTVRDAFSAGAAPDASGTTQATTERAYAGATTALGSWEAAIDNTPLYASGDTARGEGFNDGGTAFDQTITINGGGTVGLAAVVLTAAAGQQHDGTAGTGVRIVRTADGTPITMGRLDGVTMTVDAIEVDMNGYAGTGIFVPGSVATQTINHVLVHGGNNGTNDGILATTFTGGTVSVLNSIVYDIRRTTTGATPMKGVADNAAASRTVNIENVTVHNVQRDSATGDGYGFFLADSTTRAYKNLVATDVGGTTSGTTADYNLSSLATAVGATNASSDSTAPSPIAAEPVVSAVEFVSNTAPYNLHLASGAECIDAGTDLGTTPTGVNIDIDGRDRDAQGDVWDVGADEFVAVAAGQPTMRRWSGIPYMTPGPALAGRSW